MSGVDRAAEAPAVVRSAAPNDVAGIAAVEREVFGDPWSRAAFVALIDRPGVSFLVCEVAGSLAGYAVTYHAADEAELANLAVVPAFRRQRVGLRLLDAIMDVSREAGVRNIWLEVRASNTGGQALYRGYGFAEVGIRKRYYDRPVEDAIVMRRHTTRR